MRDLERLERLAKLRSDGVLTDAEFEVEKQRVLANDGLSSYASSDLRQETPTPIYDDLDLSPTWKSRFSFFDAHGAPADSSFKKSLRELDFFPQIKILFNIWGLIFGPFYFLYLGMIKRGIGLFGLTTFAGIIFAAFDFSADANRAFSFGLASIFSSFANYSYYLKRRYNSDDWLPTLKWPGHRT